MEFMFDTADLKLIRRYEDMIPYTGITTNPALIRKAGIRTGLFDTANLFPKLAEISRQYRGSNLDHT